MQVHACRKLRRLFHYASVHKRPVFLVNIQLELIVHCRFAGNAWIPLVTGGGSWSVQVNGSFTERSDNGRINSSPRTAITPIVRVQLGCPRNISIPGNIKEFFILESYNGMHGL